MRDPKDPSLFLEKCIPAVRATARTDERSRSVRHDPEGMYPASDKTCDGPTLAKSAGIDSVRLIMRHKALASMMRLGCLGVESSRDPRNTPVRR